MAIVDVTDKTDMELISDVTYAQVEYTHQGWLSEDQTFLYFNDELDERTWGDGTRTYIADVMTWTTRFWALRLANTAVDHNLYVKGDKVYASNYMSGFGCPRSMTTASSSPTPTLTFDRIQTLPRSMARGATTCISQAATLPCRRPWACSC